MLARTGALFEDALIPAADGRPQSRVGQYTVHAFFDALPTCIEVTPAERPNKVSPGARANPDGLTSGDSSGGDVVFGRFRKSVDTCNVSPSWRRHRAQAQQMVEQAQQSVAEEGPPSVAMPSAQELAHNGTPPGASVRPMHWHRSATRRRCWPRSCSVTARPRLIGAMFQRSGVMLHIAEEQRQTQRHHAAHSENQIDQLDSAIKEISKFTSLIASVSSRPTCWR